MGLSGIDILIYTIILAIALLIFFAVRWASRKIIKSNSLLRQVLTWVGTITLTILVCGGLVILGIYYENYYPSRDFDEAAWHADNEKRYEMTEDLIKSEILIGKTKHEVQEVLGNTVYKYEDRWVYYIGARPGLHLESDVLNIVFKNEKVEKVEQYEK